MTLGRRVADSLSAVRQILRQPALRRAQLAFGLYWTSETSFTVALALVAFRDGGAGAVGLVALLRMLPSALVTPALTSLADRGRRERVLVAVCAVWAGSAGATVALVVRDAPVYWIYGLAVAATMAATLVRPTHSALLPSLCTTMPQLTSANVVRGMLDAAGALLGPVLAGALVAIGDVEAVFAGTAVLSFGAAVVLLRVHDQSVRAQPRRRAIFREMAAGLVVVARRRELRLVFGLGFAQTFVRGALSVYIVVLALELLDKGDPAVGLLSACVGLGGLLGSLGVSLMVGSRRLGRWLAVALVLWGTPIGLIGAVPEDVTAAVFLAVVGVGNALIDVPLFTLPARLAADEVLARAYGVFESLVALGVGLGSVTAPALISALGLRGALVATGTLLPALAVLGWRPLAALDRRLVLRDEEIAVLRKTPMLRLLPVPLIEHLASRLRRRTVPAGTDVVEQGEPGRSFYVVDQGRAQVIGDGDPVRELGPGDGFGEIALLHDVPRTATVRATTDMVLFEMDREPFVATLAGHPASSDAADAVAAGHLANFRPAGVGL